MKKTCGVLLVFQLLTLLILCQIPSVEAREPLLMEGKKSIYQRVLTRPSAVVSPSPGENGKPVATFSRYYVYEKKTQDNKEWFEIGSDTRGTIAGWMPAENVVPWRQQIVVSIPNPAGRSPLLFFKERSTLDDIYSDFDPSTKFEEIEKSLKDKGFDERVLSKEPDTHVDIQKQFYLLPILEAEEIYTGAGPTARILKIASVSKKDEKKEEQKKIIGSKLKAFNAAIVFVIDSTISMGPYIDRTREAVRSVIETIKENELSDKVKFGLYAYRSSTEAVDGLEYVTKEYANPSDVNEGDDFLKKIESLEPAKVSTVLFDEDAYAGVMNAVESVNWSDFGGRYIIHITDAGAIESQSQYSKTKLGANEVQIALAQRGIALYSLHLKTKAGMKNHQSAQTQYSQLSHNDVAMKSFYYGVDAGDVEAFGGVVTSIANSITQQVNSAYKGKVVAGSARAAIETIAPTTAINDLAKKAERDISLAGHAMMLAYLGRENGEEAPDFFEAWVADRDPKDMNRVMLDVRVLLTKNQLSDLQMIVKNVLDAGKKGIIQPSEMFAQLRSVTAAMGRDSEQIKSSKSTKLIELGLFGEYMEGFPPYKSQILELTEEDWASMSAPQQDKLLVSLNRKLRLYDHFNRDADKWVRLVEGGDPSDDVYPIPLDALP